MDLKSLRDAAEQDRGFSMLPDDFDFAQLPKIEGAPNTFSLKEKFCLFFISLKLTIVCNFFLLVDFDTKLFGTKLINPKKLEINNKIKVIAAEIAKNL